MNTNDEVFQDLIKAIAEEFDMDACSTRLGKAIAAAQEELTRRRLELIRSANRFSDQSHRPTKARTQ